MMYIKCMANVDFRSLKPDVQESIRRRAIAMVSAKKPVTDIARELDVSRAAVHGWIRLHTQGGQEALNAHQRGRPQGGSLKPWQAAIVCRTIIDRCPDQVKLPFCLWTRDAVSDLIKRRFGIEI